MTSHGEGFLVSGRFDHAPRTRLVFGPGVSVEVGSAVRAMGGKRALVVTDAGIVKAGHADVILSSLRSAGVEVAIFDRVKENPTTEVVDDCLGVARQQQTDFLVGLGGGSSMDTAKGCNFLLTNGGRMQDYWGVGKAARPMLPLIAIPTTAGTGSECQSAALIADAVTHQKMACLDPKAAAVAAFLDPLLTLSQPPRVTACTGMDAIAHSLESAVTTKRNPISQMYSREAFRLCMGAFERVLSNPGDVEARGRMLLGAAFAGTAIENSMLGAAHSAANPLTAHHEIVHGQAVGLMLPHVIEWNARDEAAASEYEFLARSVGLLDLAALRLRLGDLMAAAGLESSLSRLGVDPAGLTRLAEEASKQWTAQFNPRKLSVPDFETLYGKALA